MASRLVLSVISLVVVLSFIFLSFPVRDKFACENCNILLFTIDTLRADHVSSYGYFQKTTPTIDLLASQGVVFTNAFSQIPHTPPSHWSIFTGLYPYKHGKFFPHDNGTGLVTLPSILKENGYVTAGFVSSKMLRGFAKEFDYFNGREEQKDYKGPIMKQANETTKSVLSWLENHSSEKFFLWVHYFDPHSPYKPPKEYDLYNYSEDPHYSEQRYEQEGLSGDKIRNDIAKYDGEIRFTDENIRIVLEKIKELGLEDKTLIILLSDHGECFGEHNFSDFGYENKKPCVFHGKTLYDEEIHIPLIIKNPKSNIKGRVQNVVETIDILPTILDVLNISTGIKTDGRSLVPLVENKKFSKNYILAQTRPRRGRFAVAVRTDEWKFVVMRPSEIDLNKDVAEQEGKFTNFTGTEKTTGGIKKFLFRIGEGERKNFFQTNPLVVENLEKILDDAFFTTLGTGSVDEDTERLLRSLGYME